MKNKSDLRWDSLFYVILTAQIFLFFHRMVGLPNDVDLQHNLFEAATWKISGEYPWSHVWANFDVLVQGRYPPVYQLLIRSIYFFVQDWGWSAVFLHGACLFVFPFLIYSLLARYLGKRFPKVLLCLAFNQIFLGVIGWQVQTPELLAILFFLGALKGAQQERWTKVGFFLGLIGLTHTRFLIWGAGICLPLLWQLKFFQLLITSLIALLPIAVWSKLYVTHVEQETAIKAWESLRLFLLNFGWMNLGLAILGLFALRKQKALLWSILGFFFILLLGPWIEKIGIADSVLQIREGGQLFVPLLTVAGGTFLWSLLTRVPFGNIFGLVLSLSYLGLQNMSPLSLRGTGPVISREEAQFLRKIELSPHAQIANFDSELHGARWCVPLLKRPCLFWRDRFDHYIGKDVERFQDLRKSSEMCMKNPDDKCLEQMIQDGVTHVYIPAGLIYPELRPDQEYWAIWKTFAERKHLPVAVGLDSGVGMKPIVVGLKSDFWIR